MTPSMKADNHYTFQCPSTGRQERYIACMFRRHKHWRGESIEADCATCMNAGKCPALRMIDRECKEAKAIYFDAIPGRVRKLPEEVTKQIENKVVCPVHSFGTGIDRVTLGRLMGHDVSEEIFAGVERSIIVPEHPQAVGSLAKPAPKPRAKAVTRAEPEGSMMDAIAGVDGSMASALNDAIKGAA